MPTPSQSESIARAEDLLNLCACGCGVTVSNGSRYRRGHNRKHDGNPPYNLEDGSVNPLWKEWYWERNKERILPKTRAWKQANPDKHREHVKRANKKEAYKTWRRAWATKRRQVRGDFRRQWRQMAVNLLLQRDGVFCGVCGLPFEPLTSATIDHIVPICCGGTDAAFNLRLVHSLCNSKRPKSTYINVKQTD